MKTLKNLAPAFLMLLLVAASGCDSLNNEEPEVASLSETDLEAASSIMAGSLADENEGMMADLNDMTANVETQGLSYARRRFSRDPLQRPCRGVNREYEKTYDAETGVHSINYSRNHEGPNCEKNVDVSLNYIFTDSEGGFIAQPRVNASEIAEIAYEGSRAGDATFSNRRGATRSRSFEQTGAWNLSGLLTNVKTLSGNQVSEGSYEYTRPDTSGNQQTISGTYRVELTTVDVTMTTSETEENLENQITGTLQYTMSMTRTINGETETREAEGTIELEGNGRALLRFNGLRQLYRVTLSDGEVEVTDSNG